jgi:hypothetical protein
METNSKIHGAVTCVLAAVTVIALFKAFTSTEGFLEGLSHTIDAGKFALAGILIIACAFGIQSLGSDFPLRISWVWPIGLVGVWASAHELLKARAEGFPARDILGNQLGIGFYETHSPAWYGSTWLFLAGVVLIVVYAIIIAPRFSE